MTKKATFGGGCFWCLEAVFDTLRGVTKVTSGYAGGSIPDPTYREVCSGLTGHAEVVQVEFDPAEISFETLVEIFFVMHDPTTLNRQGGDAGTQYRSVVFYHSDEQKAATEAAIRALEEEGAFADPIVTELAPIPTFFAAEDDHQEYYQNNSSQPYCTAVISPKVAKVRAKFAALQKNPVT